MVLRKVGNKGGSKGTRKRTPNPLFTRKRTRVRSSLSVSDKHPCRVPLIKLKSCSKQQSTNWKDK